MKKLHWVLILTLALPQIIFGQIEWQQNGNVSFSDSTRFLFQANGFRSDYSNTLSREFIQIAAFGGHVDNDLKNDVFQNLEDENNYAGLANVSAYLTFFPDSSKFGFTVGYEQSNFASVMFPQDLYQLAMYGNLSFGNTVADLSQSQEDYNHYERFAFGLVHQETGSFLSVGIYNGKNHIQYGADKLIFKTEYGSMNGFEYVEAVEIETEDYLSYESKKNDGLFKSGIGFGISGGHSFKLKKGQINVSLTDLGAINWKNLEKRDTSGTFRFEGINWDMGSDFNMRDVLDALEDSLVPNAQIVDEWRILPGTVQATYYRPLKGDFIASIGAKYQWGLNLLPELETALFYNFGANNSLWANANFGGFYGATIGLGTEIEILENSRITVGSKYFLGIVDANARATNVFLKYSLRI